jgi:lipopolysaccharide export system protein LptA
MYIYSVMLIIFLLFHGAAFGKKSPIQIQADSMSSVEKTNSVVFTGNVDAKQDDVQIRCDKMTVYYTKVNDDKKKESSVAQQVEKLTCIGNVEITRGEWLGTAKKMDYLEKLRQVILLGQAKAYQGQNMVSGEKIIYFIDEGRSQVEGNTNVKITDKDMKKKPKRVNMTIMQK